MHRSLSLSKASQRNLEAAKIPRQNNIFGQHNHIMSFLTYFDLEPVLSHTYR